MIDKRTDHRTGDLSAGSQRVGTDFGDRGLVVPGGTRHQSGRPDEIVGIRLEILKDVHLVHEAGRKRNDVQARPACLCSGAGQCYVQIGQAEMIALSILTGLCIQTAALPAAAKVAEDERVMIGRVGLNPPGNEARQSGGIAHVDLAQRSDDRRSQTGRILIRLNQITRGGRSRGVLLGPVDLGNDANLVSGSGRLHFVQIAANKRLPVAGHGIIENCPGRNGWIMGRYGGWNGGRCAGYRLIG